MDWVTFWAPNLVQWIVGGGITALVSAIVGLTARYLLKRWWNSWGQPWVEQKLGEQIDAARDARDAAEAAASESRVAKAEAQTAGKHSKEATQHLDIVGERLRDVLVENQGMAGRLDDLLSSYVRLRTIAREQGVRLPADLDPEETQALTTITGRHLLHPDRTT